MFVAQSALRKGTLSVAYPLALLSGLAQASGHYVVDDTALIDTHSCELELWREWHDGAQLNGLAPTCRLDGRWQLSLEAQRESADGEHHNHYGVALKTLWREIDEHGYGLGLVLAAEYNASEKEWAEYQAVVPFSCGWEALALHLNLGVSHLPHAGDGVRQRAAIWGMGLDYGVHARVNLIAEVSGEDRRGRHPLAQLGPRVALANGIELDLTYGRTLGGERDHHLALGLIWAF